ncbi:Serine/threonine-protein kinase PrkC [Prosthecochloris sp. CIB 2401]|nr:Serine/threonine-protein kinase PrkC [Prosthecochloris sp. CIB 2401]
MRAMKKVLLVVVMLLFAGFVADKVIMPLYTLHGSSVRVPDVTGLDAEVARGRLHQAGLSSTTGYSAVYLRDVDSSTVISQRPEAGSAVKPGRGVAILLNKRERPEYHLPDFYGMSLGDVRELLEQHDIVIHDIQEQAVSVESEEGRVVGQSLPPSTVLSDGASLSLIVGRYQQGGEVAMLPVPNVLGLFLKDAREEIIGAGFNTGNVFYEYSSQLVPSTVINQKPSANTLCEPGQVVELTIVIEPE